MAVGLARRFRSHSHSSVRSPSAPAASRHAPGEYHVHQAAKVPPCAEFLRAACTPNAAIAASEDNQCGGEGPLIKNTARAIQNTYT